MPLPQKILFVLRDKRLEPTKFVRWKSYVVFEPYGRQPELCKAFVSTYVNVWRLGTIVAGK
jgi:hypothetical protein